MQGHVKSNLLVKVAGAFQGRKNACRNLTRLIKRTPGVTLPIPISACKVHIKVRKPIRPVEVYWPVIQMGDWCQYFAAFKPELLLAGHKPNEDWKSVFRKFWDDYKIVSEDHPIFSLDSDHHDLGCYIPYFIHGDEGRGQLKRPYMVVAFQFAIGFQGVDQINDNTHLGLKADMNQDICTFSIAGVVGCRKVNSSINDSPTKVLGWFWCANLWMVPLRHTFTSRWLYTGVSSHLYYNDWTIDDLLAELTKQAIDAFEQGVCDSWVDIAIPNSLLNVCHLNANACTWTMARTCYE